MPNYDVDYFLKKFEAIPEDDWCRRVYTDADGKHCALGFCGSHVGKISDYGMDIHTEEGENLRRMLLPLGGVTVINDYAEDDFQQETPKQRVLAALRHLKAKLCPSSS